MRNDNDDNDYREEEGQRRHAKRLERALFNRDPFYPNELHEQDVKDEQEGETNEHMTLEKLRVEMVEKGLQLGFLHPEVLALSQKVDKLHNEYNREKVGK